MNFHTLELSDTEKKSITILFKGVLLLHKINKFCHMQILEKGFRYRSYAHVYVMKFKRVKAEMSLLSCYLVAVWERKFNNFTTRKATNLYFIISVNDTLLSAIVAS